jgi:hypothetical protein
MLYVIDKQSKQLREIQPTTFKELDVWERKDLERWIQDYPQILGEDLLIVTTEYDQFDKSNDRLDLLAVDKNGKLVIIELKRDMAPSTTELQAIKYAAFCSNLTMEDVVEILAQRMVKTGKTITNDEAERQIRDFIQNDSFEDFDKQPRIILVAREFRPDTTSSVLWLRTFGVDITCVKLELYSLKGETGKNTIAINPSVIIPLPDAKDFLVDRERKDIEMAELTHSQKFHRQLFERLIERFKKECPNITDRGASKDSWLGLPIGYGKNIHFEWTHRKKPKRHFQVSLDLENPNHDENQKILSRLEKDKDAITSEIGQPVIFDYHWGSNWCRLFVTNEDVDNIKSLDDWVIETTKKFYQYLKPRLDKILNQQTKNFTC